MALESVPDYVAPRSDRYPSGVSSFDWLWRKGKRRLVESGAVVVFGGRRMVDPAVIERVELEIAREAALALVERTEDGA
jgi:hypothetical protein